MSKLECLGNQVHPSSALPSIPSAPAVKFEKTFTIAQVKKAWLDAGFSPVKFDLLQDELFKNT